MQFNWWKPGSLFFLLQETWQEIFIYEIKWEQSLVFTEESPIRLCFIFLSALNIGAESNKGVFKEEGVSRMGAGQGGWLLYESHSNLSLKSFTLKVWV